MRPEDGVTWSFPEFTPEWAKGGNLRVDVNIFGVLLFASVPVNRATFTFYEQQKPSTLILRCSIFTSERGEKIRNHDPKLYSIIYNWDCWTLEKI